MMLTKSERTQKIVSQLIGYMRVSRETRVQVPKKIEQPQKILPL